MAFSTQKKFFKLSYVNETVDEEQLCNEACVTMQAYNAVIDDRSWAMDDVLQSKFFEGLLVCDMVEVFDVDDSLTGDERPRDSRAHKSNRYRDSGSKRERDGEQPKRKSRRDRKSQSYKRKERALEEAAGSESETELRDKNRRVKDDKKPRAKGRRGKGADDDDDDDDSFESKPGRESQSNKIRPSKDEGLDKTLQKKRRKDKRKSGDDRNQFSESDSSEKKLDRGGLKKKEQSPRNSTRKGGRRYEDEAYSKTPTRDSQASTMKKKSRSDSRRSYYSEDGDPSKIAGDSIERKDNDQDRDKKLKKTKDYSRREQRASKDDRPSYSKAVAGSRTSQQLRAPDKGLRRSKDYKSTEEKETKPTVSEVEEGRGSKKKQSKDGVMERDTKDEDSRRSKSRGKGNETGRDKREIYEDEIGKKGQGRGRDHLDGDQKKEPGLRDDRKTDGKDTRIDDTKDDHRDGNKILRRSQNDRDNDEIRKPASRDDKRGNGKATSKKHTENGDDRIEKKEQGQDRNYRDDDQEKEKRSRDARKTDGKGTKLDDTTDEDRDAKKIPRQSKDYKGGYPKRESRSRDNKRAKDRETGKKDSEIDEDRFGKKDHARNSDYEDGDQKKEPRPKDERKTDGKGKRLDDTKDKNRDENKIPKQFKDNEDFDQKRESRSEDDKKFKEKETKKLYSRDDPDTIEKNQHKNGEQKKDPRSRDSRRTDGKDGRLDDTKDENRDGKKIQRSSQALKDDFQKREPKSRDDKRGEEASKNDTENRDDRIGKKEQGQDRVNKDAEQKQEPRPRDGRKTDGKDTKMDDTKDDDRDAKKMLRRSKDYKDGDPQRGSRSRDDKRNKDKETGKKDSEIDEDRVGKKDYSQDRDYKDKDQKKETTPKDNRAVDAKDTVLDDTKEGPDGSGIENQGRSKDYKDDYEKRELKSRDDKISQGKPGKDYTDEVDRPKYVTEGNERGHRTTPQKSEDTYDIRQSTSDISGRPKGDGRMKRETDRDGPQDQSYRNIKEKKEVDSIGLKAKAELAESAGKVSELVDVGRRPQNDKLGKDKDLGVGGNGKQEDRGGRRKRELGSMNAVDGDHTSRKLDTSEKMRDEGKKGIRDQNDRKRLDDRIERNINENLDEKGERISRDVQSVQGISEGHEPVYDKENDYKGRAGDNAKKIYDRDRGSGRSSLKKEQVSETSRKYKNRDKPDDHGVSEAEIVYGEENERGRRQRSHQRPKSSITGGKPMHDEENANGVISKDGGAFSNEKTYDDKARVGREQQPTTSVDTTRIAREKIKRENEERVIDDDYLVGTGSDGENQRGKRIKIPEDDQVQVKPKEDVGLEERVKKEITGDSDMSPDTADSYKKFVERDKKPLDGFINDSITDENRMKIQDGANTLKSEVDTGSHRADRGLKSEPYSSQTRMYTENRIVESPVTGVDANICQCTVGKRILQRTSFIAQIFGINSQQNLDQSSSGGQTVQRRSLLEQWFGVNQSTSEKTICECTQQTKLSKEVDDKDVQCTKDNKNKQGKVKNVSCEDTSLADTNDLCNISFIDKNLGENSMHDFCNKIETLRARYNFDNDTEIEINELCSMSKDFLQAYQCMSAENGELRSLCEKLGDEFSGKYIDVDAEKLKKITMERNELRKKCQRYKEMEKRYEALQEKDSSTCEKIKKLSCDLNKRNSFIDNLESKCREMEMFYDNKCEIISNQKEELEVSS